MLNDRYGDLLDKVMNKKDDEMVQTAGRLAEIVRRNRQEEIDRHNRAEWEREQKRQVESEKLRQQESLVNRLLDKTRQRQAEEDRQRAEAKREAERIEMNRRTRENLNWTPKKLV